jgi:tetratricopeptide (TPR) repeat protein
MADTSRADRGSSLRAFIASASGALAPYRETASQVCYRLHLTPVLMEGFDPERGTPLEVCRQKVADCDVFVLLLAHRYGARPPGQRLSYTELEYEWAAARTEMPLLAFVMDPDFPWPPRQVDSGTDAEALNAFKARVRSRHEARRLTDVATFREDLLVALSRLIPAPSPPPVPDEERQASRADGPPGPAPGAPEFHAMPPYIGSAPFTGRAEDLALLDAWGRSGDPVMVVEAIGGTGKSALTWEWATTRTEAVIDGLAGRMWWSFYDGSASMTQFLRELLAYVSGRPKEEVGRLSPPIVADEVLTALRSRPYLVILDGFERLLTAYHRFDPSKLRDDEVQAEARSLIESDADDVVRRLTAVGPSKLLISTRLTPLALEGQFGRELPGVSRLRLPGLSDADMGTLLARLGVRGRTESISEFFGSLGNHPLLAGLVAGLVNDYRPAPGDFDAWLGDPAGGGALRIPALSLTQRRTHILAAALTGLDPGSQRLLGWMSVLAGAVDWETLVAISPFRPPPPTLVRARPKALAWLRRREHAGAPGAGPRALARLDATLKDLEDRGLLWWDRSSNTYDLHPIIRAYAHDHLEASDRIRANDRIRDHFASLPPDDLGRATSVEDLTRTITIFRALVGAGRVSEAEHLWWATLNNALTLGLAAYPTCAELLGPLAMGGSVDAQEALAIVYILMGRIDEALHLATGTLAARLRDEDVPGVRVCLMTLRSVLIGTSAAASRRVEDFLTALDAEAGTSSSPLLLQVMYAAFAGQVDEARSLLAQLDLVADNDIIKDSFEADVTRFYHLYLAFRIGEPITLADFTEAFANLHSELFKRELLLLRSQFAVQQGDLDSALDASQRYDRLCRKESLEIGPAQTAYVLARLGRADEATAAVEDSLARLHRVHATDQPRYQIARALRELGRLDEAVAHAREAYRIAWADGPPNYHYWELRDARELLEEMGEPLPELPVLDPATVKIPMEDEVRAFITKLEAKRRDAVG